MMCRIKPSKDEFKAFLDVRESGKTNMMNGAEVTRLGKRHCKSFMVEHYNYIMQDLGGPVYSSLVAEYGIGRL